MSLISQDVVIQAVMIVAMMMVILSIPSILLTVRNSASLLKRYRLLRSIKDVGDEKEVPPNILNEWNAVNSPMAYTTLITEEIERLNGLRPALFQAELAALLIIILAIYPGFDSSVLIFMMIILVAAIASVVYGMITTKKYRQEYLVILKEISDRDESNRAADGMYG